MRTAELVAKRDAVRDTANDVARCLAVGHTADTLREHLVEFAGTILDLARAELDAVDDQVPVVEPDHFTEWVAHAEPVDLAEHLAVRLAQLVLVVERLRELEPEIGLVEYLERRVRAAHDIATDVAVRHAAAHRVVGVTR